MPDGVVGAAIVAVLSLAKRDFNAFLLANKDFIDKQDKALQDTLGTQQYNTDKQIIKDAVYAAEQMGKEFNWTGELKHSKVLELIEGKTGLSDEEIFNLIKAVVLEVNSLQK